MKVECKRCGYAWSTRSAEPKRCPHCKTVRWNKSKIGNTCMRCGATWAQRGENVPKYCPVCHSTMWDVSKTTYTCPKCGQTRILKSNSRPGKCPFCDSYNDKIDHGFSESQVKNYGISPMTHLWSNGNGITLNTSDNFGIAYLYRNGELINSVNLPYQFKKYGVTLTGNTDFETQPIQKILDSIVANIISEETDKPGSRDEEKSIHDYRNSGMNPVLISLKLHIPFNKVMNVINNMPEE